MSLSIKAGHMTHEHHSDYETTVTYECCKHCTGDCISTQLHVYMRQIFYNGLSNGIFT